MTFVSTKKLEKPIPEGMSPQKAPCGLPLQDKKFGGISRV